MRQAAAGEAPTAGPIAPAGSDLQGLQGALVRPPGVRLAPDRSLVRKPTGSLAGLGASEAIGPGLQLDRPVNHVARPRVEAAPGGSAPGQLVISTGDAAPVTAADVSRSVAPSALAVLDGGGSSDAEAAPSARPPVRPVAPRRGPSER